MPPWFHGEPIKKKLRASALAPARARLAVLVPPAKGGPPKKVGSANFANPCPCYPGLGDGHGCSSGVALQRPENQGSKETNMKTYSVLFAQDVPHYGSVEIQAENDTAALEAAKAYDLTAITDDPDWGTTVC